MNQKVDIVKAELIQAISKSGKPYIALDVYITPTTSKRVFLSDAEIELIRMNQPSK